MKTEIGGNAATLALQLRKAGNRAPRHRILGWRKDSIPPGLDAMVRIA